MRRKKQTHYDVHQRALAAPGLADETDTGALRDDEVDVTQRIAAFAIVEADMCEGKLALEPHDRLAADRVGILDRRIEQDHEILDVTRIERILGVAEVDHLDHRQHALRPERQRAEHQKRRKHPTLLAREPRGHNRD